MRRFIIAEVVNSFYKHRVIRTEQYTSQTPHLVSYIFVKKVFKNVEGSDVLARHS